EQAAPEFRLPLRSFVIAGAVRVQTGGNNPRFAEEMIEDDEAAVKTDVAIRKFEIVDRQARELRLNEIFQIVAPVAKAAPQRAQYRSAGGVLSRAELAGKPPRPCSFRLIRQSSQVDSSNNAALLA